MIFSLITWKCSTYTLLVALRYSHEYNFYIRAMVVGLSQAMVYGSREVRVVRTHAG